MLIGLILVALTIVAGILSDEYLYIENPDTFVTSKPNFANSTWLIFSDPRFELRFSYPETTSNGHLVNIDEYNYDIETGILFTSNNDELYFEVALILNESATELYKELETIGKNRSKNFYLSGLRKIKIGDYQGFEFNINSRGEEGIVIFIQKNSDVYQIIYDPRSRLNCQILSSIEFF